MLFKNQTFCVIACGPSLTKEQVDRCKQFPTVVVNNAYQLAPWADALYACDSEWWEHYKPDFSGLKFSYSYTEVMRVPGHHEAGLSEDKDHIHLGHNSGFQAVNLAVNFGANRILLVGFDYRMTGKRHFFGDHPGKLNKAGRYDEWARFFNDAKPSFDRRGVEVINCTPGSAITAFPFGDICKQSSK